jgi:glutamate dehydrogenase/leucine dehydrogenase
MQWMRDEYEKIVGHSAPGVVTGKPIKYGGSLGRETSTSRGGFHIVKEYFKDADPGTVKVAVQGFGNVGSHLAELLHDAGFKVIAVSDSQTGLYNANGLDIPSLLKHKKEREPFAKRPEEKITNDGLLELDVELLVPAALGGIITQENAGQLKAKVIIEMANAPVVPEADPVLEKHGITIIPDILANAGGVIVSYFEWKQNIDDERWSEKKVHDALEKVMIEAYKKVRKESSERSISMRSASYVIAINRILEAEQK